MKLNYGGRMTDSTAWDIVVVGGANIDYMVRGSKLPTPGDAVEGKDFHEAGCRDSMSKQSMQLVLATHFL
ncbi:MAG: hypothetical protein HC908_03925 [Calothrix sp. SM1_7_51]|nr:hypothetical protein [Calothrix sp. SM1_7_51]